jgi:peptide/nickel transport system substrate-binding protein
MVDPRHMNEVADGNHVDGVTRRQLMGRSAALAGTVAFAGALAACGDDDGGTTEASSPKRGGSLRVGFVGGGPAETIDPHSSVAFIDAARAKNLFDKLTDYKSDLSIEYLLAESMEPDSTGEVWQIKLRRGVEFHDGKPLTAQDVLYTIQRNLDPKNALQGAIDLEPVDLDRTKVVSNAELSLAFKQPIADVPTLFAARTLSIVQDGATTEQLTTKPVGTGPFVHQQFKAGDRATMAANRNYWVAGRPIVDELVTISIPDNAARLNALIGGQIDAMENVDFAQAKARMDSPQLKIIRAKGSNMVPITMAADQKPFNDVRVRQAMRLIADRQQLLETAFSGFGQIGNDVYGIGLPYYNDELPQREPDIEQARSLLQQAGMDGARFSLASSNAAPGMLESATLFAEQARDAGITIEIDQSPADSFYSDKYLKVPFAQTQWGTQSIESQIVQGLLADAAFNETGWRRPDFDRRFREARGTLDEGSREEQYFELQQELYDEGGYLIWGFNDWVDAVSPRVNGVEPSPIFALGWYDFKEFWLA